MRIQVNGELLEVDDTLSLPQLISSLNLKPDQIAIELNHRVIRRSQWESVVLTENDRIEIVHFVGGGWAKEQGQEQGSTTIFSFHSSGVQF